MTSATVEAKTNTYYNWSQFLYDRFCRASKHHAMHNGYYEPGEDRSPTEAIAYLNRKLADAVDISASDHVLDAGG